MTTTSRRKVGELMRLAFLYAQQDREGFLDAIRNSGMDDEERETRALIKELRQYRLKRWGKTKYEAAIEKAPSKTIDEIRKMKP